MLKEFAFTPQVFDPQADPANERWRECLQVIAIRLFTPSAVPIVVAGLHCEKDDSTWEYLARKTVEAIADQNLRIDAEKLFGRLVSSLVVRPPCCDWPGDDEAAWGREAADSHALEPLHLVIAQHPANVPPGPPASGLAGALSIAFWNALADEPEARSMVDDVQRLRTLLVHSDHLVMSAPYATTEAFFLACIRKAAQRPAGFKAPTIDFHHPLTAGTRRDSREADLREKLGALAGRGLVRWWASPNDDRYRERLILGGVRADLGGGHSKFSPRWGVMFNHVWGEGDGAGAEPRGCRLLPPGELKRHADALRERATKPGVVGVAL